MRLFFWKSHPTPISSRCCQEALLWMIIYRYLDEILARFVRQVTPGDKDEENR